MGASYSSKMSEEEQQRRRVLANRLEKMRKTLDKTAESHYESSDYYKKWELDLQYASWVTGIMGSPWPGIVLSTRASKTANGTSPRFAAIFGAASAMCLAFTFMVNSSLPNSPKTLAQQHFITGLECRKLEKQVQFFAENDVLNAELPWSMLCSKYEDLLEKRKEVNSRIKSEHWAYDAVKARKQKKRNGKAKRTNSTNALLKD